MTRLLRRGSAATRHLVWTSTIAGVLALPLLTLAVPAWNVPVVTIAAPVDAPQDAPAVPRSSVLASDAAPVAAPVAGQVVTASGGAELTPSRRTEAIPATEPRPRNVPGLLAFVWLTFALLLLARLAIANARLSAWQRSSRPVEDARWLALVLRLTREYGIERPVVLLENPDTDVPLTWGVVYPVILLPAGAEVWDEEQRIAVLTHELAHVKRFDALSQMLAQLALALLWFHPLAWMAVRRMRLEREHACDDFVLVAGARASRYADDLLGIARRLNRPTAPAAAALAMARRSELEGRLLAILDPATKRTSVRRARVGVLTLGVFLLSVPLAAFRPVPRETAEPAPRPAATPATPSPAVPAGVASADTARIDRSTDFLAATTASRELEALLARVGAPLLVSASEPTLPVLSQIRPDTEPQRPIDVQTLVEVTRAAKRMTSDYEKGQLLGLIAKRYVQNDTLRDAYLEAVFTMTSDYERSKALIALLERDSIPASSTAKVLRSAALMTSDMNRGMVLKRISAATFADSAVQRAYLDVIVAMTSDTERGQAIATLLRQKPLTPGVQLALLRATTAITSNTEKANVLLFFVQRQGITDETVRKAFFNAAETLTSDGDYRRVMTAVMR